MECCGLGVRFWVCRSEPLWLPDAEQEKCFTNYDR